jgi:hypothetical protein
MLLADAGAKVVIADKDREGASQTAEQIGAAALAIPFELEEDQSIEDLFEQAMARFGRIDALVNNAGIYPRYAFEQVDRAQWQQINVWGCFQVLRCAARAMRAGGAGGASSTFHLLAPHVQPCSTRSLTTRPRRRSIRSPSLRPSSTRLIGFWSIRFCLEQSVLLSRSPGLRGTRSLMARCWARAGSWWVARRSPKRLPLPSSCCSDRPAATSPARPCWWTAASLFHEPPSGTHQNNCKE